MTTDTERIAKLAQACFASNPVIVLGSGASAAHGLPGMSALKDFLLLQLTTADSVEEDSWTLVRTALANGDHLEQALLGKTLPASLTRKIVRLTWECINTSDRKVFQRALLQQESFAVGSLLKSLFFSSNKSIDIVTTNYDRVAEYACGSVDLLHAVGFSPGYIQSREGSDQISYWRSGKQMRTARIWKVHGSLDWFQRVDGSTLSAPLFELPDEVTNTPNCYTGVQQI